MDAALRLTGNLKDILPCGGPVAAHITFASRGLYRDGRRALATAPEEPFPGSDGPDSCADKSSDSSGCPEVRCGNSPDGNGYFTRDDFLYYYGDINGAARWALGAARRIPEALVSLVPAESATRVPLRERLLRLPS